VSRLDSYKAFVVEGEKSEVEGSIQELTEDDLPVGDVTVRIDWSSLNYKDGLAISGSAPIIRRMPMTAGIDFAGIVETSENSDFAPGDQVVLTGWGVGEMHPGGFAQYARVKGEWLEKLPKGLNTKTAMAVGTAGFTSILCVMALEKAGLKEASGPIIVTGAAGGVGSIAVATLSSLGYEVCAVTGRESSHEFLKSLGADSILSRSELAEIPAKPLLSERWAGAIDPVGGTTLTRLLTEMKYGSAIAACGLAGGSNLKTTVLPFILRGIQLIGIDSVMCRRSLRRSAWNRIAIDLPLEKLSKITEVEPMSNLSELSKQIVKGQTQGRIVIDVNK